MRVLILFLFITYIFANEVNNTEINNTNTMIDENKYEINNTIVEKNTTYEINNTLADEVNDTKINPPIQMTEEYIQDIQTYENELSIAVILDKKKFFKFIPSLLNSINAYLIKKDINYHIKLYDMDENLTKELNDITKEYQYIFTYFTDTKKVKELNNYPDNYFFIPTLSKNQVEGNVSDNIYFGGMDYKDQINKLNQYINDFTIIIRDNSQLSKYITQVVNKELLQPHTIKKYPIRYTKAYDNSFVYMNTKTPNTAQILSTFTYKKISPKSIFSTQINYSPLIFLLTNPEDIQNIIIANSIFDINPIIEDNNLNLGSDINFNWLNFATSTLLNEAYLLEIEEYKYFLNDFNLYIFNNQVNYHTNLYRIKGNGFIKIAE